MAKRPRPGINEPIQEAGVDSTPAVSPPGRKDTTHQQQHQQRQQQHPPLNQLRRGGLEEATKRLSCAADRPEDFFQANEALSKELTSVLQQLYATARRSETQRKPFGPLDQLYVHDLDCESIWSELELRNMPLEKHIRKTLARLLESEDMSLAADLISDDADDGDDDDEGDDGDDEGQAEAEEGEDDYAGDGDVNGDSNGGVGMDHGGNKEDRGTTANIKAGKEISGKGQGKKMKAEDEDSFFDSDDMDNFADEGTDTMEGDLGDGVLKEMYGGDGGSDDDDRDDDDDAALMEKGEEMDMSDDDDDEARDDEQVGGGIKHSDFFDDGGKEQKGKSKAKKKKKAHRRQDNNGDDSDVEDDDEKESTTHESFARHMQTKISDQEMELLAEKPWALRGEVHSHDRPQNSLLEAVVDVERATRVPPPPTAELAMSLLDIIKKRCLDANWDDVTPRNIQGPAIRKEAPHLSQDKSNEGLADLYEKEFLKKTMAVTEEDPQANLKNDLKQLFAKLSGKLDALCNFHYTPKPIVPEMKVQADVAAIAMEEVLPSSVAEAEALAPEEIYAKKRGRDAEFLEGGEEMAQEDRKRARSSKKAVRRKKRRQAESAHKLVSKLNPGLGNKYEKAKMLRDIQSAKNVTTVAGDEGESNGREFSTSTKFFTQLQETVETSIKSAGKGSERHSKEGNDKLVAQLRL